MNKEEKNEKLSKELIKLRKGNKEEKIQQIRKNMEKSSRLLDNYYNPKIHNKNWQPNGTFKAKPSIQSNTIQEKPSSKQKEQIHYLEFDYMEPNDIIVIIEHCANCEEHQSHTQHINDIFRHIAKLLQKAIVTRFPFIKVYLKPIENITARIGAFEVQYAMRLDEDKPTIIPLWSKLNSGIWPSIYNILNKISTIVPLLDIKCVLFDKEEGLENNDNVNNEHHDINALLLPSRYENIKVNLYQCFNPTIAEISNEAMDSLDVIFNPKRRAMEFKSNGDDFMGNQTNSTMRPMTSRPMTSMTTRSNRSNSSKRPISTNRSRFSYTTTPTNGNISMMSYSRSQSQLSKIDIIDDIDTLNSVKGKLLSSGYSDREGVLIFRNVPYDSYLLEIENSKNFLQCGSVLKFSKITKSSSKGLYMMNKIFGLRRQIDSFVEVYIYSTKENELDMELISKAKVNIVRRYGSDSMNMCEDVFDLKESDTVKGRYEIVTTPGRMTLNVIKEGYEKITKEVELKCGENKINIQLN